MLTYYCASITVQLTQVHPEGHTIQCIYLIFSAFNPTCNEVFSVSSAMSAAAMRRSSSALLGLQRSSVAVLSDATFSRNFSSSKSSKSGSQTRNSGRRHVGALAAVAGAGATTLGEYMAMAEGLHWVSTTSCLCVDPD